MSYRFIGKSLARSEDSRLVQGLGRYTSDLVSDNAARLWVLRSPHASARIVSIDVTKAASAPGVRMIMTGTDPELLALGTFTSRIRRKAPDGLPNFEPPYRVLTFDRAQFVGDPVVAVIADTLNQAKDAAELVAIEWEVLPAIADTRIAADPGVPQVWAEVPRNICFVHNVGDAAAVEGALAQAHHKLTFSYPISRIIAAPMETRAALASYDKEDDILTLHAGLQNPHYVREELAERIFKIDGNKLRVVSPDVGGAFGLKEAPFPEYALALMGAQRLNRQVLWVCDRTESFAADHHARDHHSKVTLGFHETGKLLALKFEAISNIGAYISFNGLHTPVNNLGGLSGVYRTPHICAQIHGVFTNTPPTSPYRGAGRPEAIYAIERGIDLAAQKFGFDRVELRRINMITANEMPYDTGFLYTYDCGDFIRNMDDALIAGDWKGFAARLEAARRRGRLLGIGIANAIEIANGPAGNPHTESAEIRFDSTGAVTVSIGTHSQGQGHEITFKQIVADLLGLDVRQVKVRFGDTEQLEHGTGTFGSRSVAAGSVALVQASDAIVRRAKKIASAHFETDESDVQFANGVFMVSGTDKKISLPDVARLSYRLPLGAIDGQHGLSDKRIVAPESPTFPNGCHVCEVEIDPNTGQCQLLRYCVVDDVGRMINPMLVKGQIHGGVAQGVGQILTENIIYDEEGQLVTGSFMDYALPRATDVPKIVIKSNEVLTKTNPLGVKGAGEAGTVGALAAVVNAIVDALSPFGIDHIDMPVTSERIWRAIRSKYAA